MSLIESRLTLIFLPLALALLLSYNVRAQQSFLPSAIPLAVRSPYLSGWNDHSNNAVIGQSWQMTIDDSQLGWTVLVRVDGLTYSFLGNTFQTILNGTVNLTSLAVTPTQTVVTGQAGPMQVNLTFLNPIVPHDWIKQSIPFSYLSFTANSLDGARHAVQVYSDVSGEWNSGDRSKIITWKSSSTVDVIFHSVTLQTSAVFTEINDQAEWGTLYYAMLAGHNVTNKILTPATDCRSYFARNGMLDNQHDPTIGPISNPYPIFAIARDLGTIQATQAPVVWTVGYTTDPAINYADQSLSGAPPTPRRPYYKTRYPDDESLIIDFLKDFSNASSRAQELDNQILQDANSVSSNLGGLASVTIAQVYGSMQLTIGTDAHGNLNNSDIMIFMKNIGGFGATRITAVETLYAAFPALMYIDWSLGGPLLEPLFLLQASRNHTIGYAAADLGSNYPNVSISNSNHSQGVEQTGNMLIMTYAYARASGDGSLISRHYSLLTSWADYLNASALFNSNQHSADDLSVNNQTNLAIKGIIAIEAMSKMSSAVNQTADANKYSNAAASLYKQWKSLALSSDQHLLAVYGQNNSWTLGYNLFADVWLGTNLVESSVYDGHSNFIDNLLLTSDFGYFGMPVDNVSLTGTSVVVSSWSLFAAAMTTNQGLRSELISRVSKRASSTNTSGVFPVYYSSGDGTTAQGVASPAQGAVFAPLALKVPAQTIKVNSATTSRPSRKIGIIAGGISVFIVVAIFALFVLWRRRRRPISPTADSDSIEADPHAIFSSLDDLRMIVTPFDINPSEEIITQTEQQPLMATEGPEGEMIALRPLSQTPTPPTVLARSRPQAVASVSAGLSDKELARIRQEARAWPTNGLPQEFHNGSSPNVSHSESTFSPEYAVASGSGEATSSLDTPRPHPEVESLRREVREVRREVERLRAEEPPPSYTSGDI